MDNLETKELLSFVKSFFKKYNQYPCIGFLAGYYKKTPQSIYYHFDKLEKSGKLVRERKNKYNNSYKLT